ncbi:MAG: hydroxyacid dehydrogenase [Devosia sp. 67-54]|uniref:hydroxyacid dehydrogenase n=1 Tax=unclassified Devosia TaxID=196773 RepID=UPI00096842BF|nr:MULTISPECIES: hydroxyacid dehydrogenase [unclassified Devosia]MBN9305741.1 hydroxyacid dehydrogenase [Devosia sp.]OJX16603.1 MAG: hydroxyacid dehydrogenase [Devosia sp. 67-54]
MMRPKLAFAMSPGKTRFVFDEAALSRLGELCEVLSDEPLHDFTDAAARAVLHDTEILVTGWGCPFISREVVAAAPRLKLIAHAAGTVKYHLDPVVFEAGIAVTNAVAANAVPVAEYTLAMIILANKQALQFRDLYREDRTRGTSYALMDTPIGNYRRTVGIVGASHIGRRVVELLRPFDFTVLLYDPHVRPGDEICRHAELVDLDELIARSDVVSLHAPSLPSTRHMIGRRELGLMRNGATLINTARGALVDEAALVAELETGRVSAVIDVTDPEIPAPDSPLFTLPNVVLTPHIAGAVGSERSRLGNLMVEEIERFAAGRPLHHQVQPSLLLQLA